MHSLHAEDCCSYLVGDAGADIDRGEGGGLHNRAELSHGHEVGQSISDGRSRQVGDAVGDRGRQRLELSLSL